jgi:hypothetical protein
MSSAPKSLPVESFKAIQMAASLAVEEGHCGAIAFSRTGDPALGEFEDALILKTIGEVDIGLLSVQWRSKVSLLRNCNLYFQVLS